jgi:hypothetical protein
MPLSSPIQFATVNNEFKAIFRPQLRVAWSRPPALRGLVAAVGAPLVYASVCSSEIDNEVFALLKNAARLQLLRSAQTRRQAAALLTDLLDQGFTCCAVGGLVSAWTCFLRPSHRILAEIDLLTTPGQFNAIIAWLRDQGYTVSRPISQMVSQKIWERLDPGGFSPLHPARGNLRVRLLDAIGELGNLSQNALARAVVVETPEGLMPVLSSTYHALYLAAQVNGCVATRAKWLQAVFDLVAYDLKHGDVALSQGTEFSRHARDKTRSVLAGVTVQPKPRGRSSLLRAAIAARLAAGGRAENVLLGLLNCGPRLSGLAWPKAPLEFERLYQAPESRDA